MSLIGSSILAGASGAGGAYTIDQSLRFEDGDSNYLSWTPSSAGTRTTWTYSVWVKRGNLTTVSLFNAGSDNNAKTQISLGASDLNVYEYNGSWVTRLYSDANFRDASAWYHIVVYYDTTNATESDRVKVYVNGDRLTSFQSTVYYPSQNHDSYINNNIEHTIGVSVGGSYMDGHLAEAHFIDGQALGPEYFAETDNTYGHWKPIEYSGTYGTNGFYLPFKQDYSVEGMSTTLYTGIGSNSVGTHYIGGVGFRPDLVWIKDRETTYQHVLFDSVRGPGRRAIQSNSSASEGMPNNSYDRLVAFDADGFTHHGGQYGSGYVDRGGADYVAWCWDMGGRNTVTGFGATTWTGDSQQQLITGIGFQPDLVWLKRRDTADSHGIFDSVRGATKWLAADQNWSTTTTSNSLFRFEKDGFTIGSYSNFNYLDDTFVGYGWDMGGSNASNTDGSITSTVRANTTYGQSIISYTGNGTQGATIGHGLSQAPEFVMVKVTNTTNNWHGWHTGLTSASYGIYWDLSNAESSNSNQWDDTAPSSSVITLGNNAGINGNSNDYICYAFHSVSGYSKFGTYTGDGTTDGSKTISLGFRPAFVMIKRIDSAVDWKMFDNIRNPVNPVDKIFQTNTNDAEGDYDTIEFNDTSFGLLDNGGAINNDGSSYIYIAFAGGADNISDYNSDGSIDSRVRANTTYGQSIVSDLATGNDHTIGHGLDSAPEMIFRKKRNPSTSRNWAVWHKDLTDGYALEGLHSNGAEVSGGSPNKYIRSVNSTNFTVGNDVSVNESGGNYISYCFHSVSGYSKIGSYTGNGGGSDNAITGLGFAPAWIMIKNITNSGSWRIIDKVRNPVNTSSQDATLYPDLTAGEGDSTNLDWDSDGFTLNSGETDGDTNTNGDTYIYMAFADTREYGFWLDQSGNNNDWTIGEGGTGNLDESDISVDTPSNNFATWNPINKQNIDLLEGNLKVDPTSGTQNIGSTMFVNSGKWYWELHPNGTSEGHYVGIATPERLLSENVYSTNSILFNESSGLYTSSSQGSQSGDSWANSTGVVRFKLDLDSQTFGYAVDDGSFTTVTITSYDSHTSGEYWGPWYGNASGSQAMWWNFGQDSSFAGKKTAQGNQDSNGIGDFYYEPPSGYLALCTSNLPTPAVVPSKYFNTVTYTGNSSNPASVTGVGFQPDLVWAKTRSFGNTNHRIQDAVRGSNKRLASDTSDVEANNDGGIQSFDSDGFTVGDGTNKDGYIHFGGRTFVAWNWKANGSGASNTDGDITSTVSVNTDAGFSIVSYTGDGTDGSTIGHGLSSAPEIAIFKNRTTGASWATFGYPNTSVFTEDGSHLLLDQDYAISNSTTKEVSLGSSLITIVDAGGDINTNNDDYICYCWHSVDGYSKIGSYTGNGSTDGTFVYTGFRPAWVMIKRTDDANNWWIADNKRYDINDDSYDKGILADTNDVEGVHLGNEQIDLLSNGFKPRSTNGVYNTSGTYLYIAFAENPFKYSNAR